ncbi:hypothetical protein [Candidatus Nitrospira bockiana]
MGFTVRLQKEGGELVDALHDPKGFIGRYLPPVHDTSYLCLRFMDRYGDTYFNQLQMDPFLKEWENISSCVNDEEGRKPFLTSRNLGSSMPASYPFISKV